MSIPFLQADRLPMDIVQELRLRFLRLVLGFGLVANLAIVLAELLGGGDIVPFATSTSSASLSLVALLFLFLLNQRRWVGLVSTVTLLIIVSFTYFTEHEPTLVVLLTLSTTTAGLLGNRGTYWLINTLVIVRVLWRVMLYGSAISGTVSAGTFIGSIIGALLLGSVPLVMGAMVFLFTLTLERSAQTARQSARLLQASADIAQEMAQMLQSGELLQRAVEIIQDRFGLYYVQVFLLDEGGGYATLEASIGVQGQQHPEMGLRVPINTGNVVGRAAQSQDVMISPTIRTQVPDHIGIRLPETQSQLTLPIQDRQGIIGVLDVQSAIPNAFGTTQIQALQVIANQLATAIRNARLFEEQQRTIDENKQLYDNAQNSLREIRRLNRQLTREAWDEYFQGKRRITGVQLDRERFDNNADWSDTMLQAGQRQRPISERKDGKHVVAVPIRLRGEVIGVMEVEADAQPDPESTVDLMDAIAQRLAGSLENARLFEETQETTAQEQQIGELVSRYQEATSIDDLLQVTLQGLAETLGAEQGTIRLGMMPQHSPTANRMTALHDSQADGGTSE